MSGGGTSTPIPFQPAASAPLPDDRNISVAITVPGMTLRDYFAGQALAGLAVMPEGMGISTLANVSYKIADAMLAERAKK